MYKIETIHRYSSPVTISGDWVMRSTQLKKDFPVLTEADLLFERGREEELIARLETKLSKDREEVISILKKGRLERI